MKIVRETSPYIRKPVSVSRMMGDVLIALSPVVIFAIIQFRWRAVLVLALSLVAMIGTEALALLVRYKKDFKQKFTINNILAPAISGTIFAMLLPTGADLGMLSYSILVCGALGILLSKMVFGGLGSNIFNPAAASRILMAVCFSSVLVYNVSGTFDTFSGATALGMIQESGIGGLADVLSQYSLLDLFLGNVPGSIGEVSALAIIVGGVYLIVRRSVDWRIMLSMFLTFALIMLGVGIAYNITHEGINPFEYMLFNILSGGFMFGLVFMVTDPITSPVTKGGRIIYGFLIGALVAIIRLYGSYPEGVAFSILIANLCVPAIDYYKWAKNKYSFNLFAGLLICFVAIFAICIGYVFNLVGQIIITLCIILAVVCLFLLSKYKNKRLGGAK